jgi:hypothetical protein
MKVTLAAVADAANVDANKKLSVFGVFDRINALRFPVAHPSMALAVRFVAEQRDGGRAHDLRIRLLDEDGAILLETKGQMNVPPIPAGEFAALPLTIQLTGLAFNGPGKFHFEIVADALDGSPISVPFIVAPSQPSA